MATNYVSDGDRLVVTAPANVSSGDGIFVGSIFGVCIHDALSGEDVVIQLNGVWTLPKLSTDVWTVGELVYWDVSDAEATTTTTTDTVQIGVATAAAANPTTTGQVRLNGTF